MDILKSVNLIKADGTKKPSSEALAGKDIILIYFSAHWCPPCRGFTPILKDFYEVCAHIPQKLEKNFLTRNNTFFCRRLTASRLSLCRLTSLRMPWWPT